MISRPYPLREDEANQDPHQVVERHSWWNLLDTTKNDGRMQQADRALRKSTSEEEEQHGKCRTDKPEPAKITVGTVRCEDSLRPNDRPDDAILVEDTTVGARVFVDLLFVADVVYVTKRPVELTQC